MHEWLVTAGVGARWYSVSCAMVVWEEAFLLEKHVWWSCS